MAGPRSRDEIFAKIAAYHRDAGTASQEKMLDRDLSTLERAGTHVERKAGRYFVPVTQFERRIRAYVGETMQPTALDSGLLLWIPRQPG